jgi:hypothetical protein
MTEQPEETSADRAEARPDEVVIEVRNGPDEETIVVVEEVPEKLPILIEVNRKPVVMNQHRATGLQIKEAAIAQGVQIEANFSLAIRHHGRTEPVRDNQEIQLHEGESFVANAADDNS